MTGIKKMSKKNAIIAAALVGILAIGSTFAYFIDRDSVTNHFTVGDVEISVDEPSWDPEDAKDITPNKEMSKDPVAKNDGVNDAYVFMTVTIPKADVKTANDDGMMNGVENRELFTYTINDGWKAVGNDITNDKAKYVYAYVDGSDKLRTLAAGQTTGTLFDKVKFINVIEGQVDGQDLDIDVDVMAIQTADLGTDDPAEIYQIIVNQQ